MSHVTNTRIRLAAWIALGASLLAAAAPTMASSPIVASWVWIR